MVKVLLEREGLNPDQVGNWGGWGQTPLLTAGYWRLGKSMGG